MGSDPTALIQFGVLGVILMLVLFGFLWAKPSVDHLIAEKDRAQQQRDELLDTYQTQVIPVLTQVIPLLTDVKDKMVPGMADLARDVQALREDIKRIEP